MKRSSLLLTAGLLGALAVGAISLGSPALPAAHAAPARGVGTPTPPPAPTAEPTEVPPTEVPPTQVPPTARPTEVPTPPPSAVPSEVPPTEVASSPIPTRTPERHRDPDPTATPTATPLPTATPEVPWTTEVEIHKQADKTQALPGDTVVYTLVAKNTGQQDAFDVVVSDAVPAQLAVTNLQSSQGDIVVHGQTVTAYPGTLAAGGTATYRITAQVREDAQGDIPNTARITTTTTGDTPGNNTSTVTLRVRVPDRTIQRAPAPRMPVTAAGDEVPLIATVATIPPTGVLGIFGGMLAMLGGVLSWGLRGRMRQQTDGPETAAPRAAAVGVGYVLPVGAVAGPPQLGPELPPPAPPAPLPPLVAVDRDEAIRDALRDLGAEDDALV